MNTIFKLPLLSALLCLAALSFSGCASNPALTKAVIRTTVSTGVAIGAERSPSSVPYLRAAAPVICSAANSTNLSPAAVTSALESSSAAALKTQEGALIMNGALSLYMTLWDAYGSNVKNNSILQNALEGTCEGIQLGLPGTAAFRRALSRPRIR